MIKDILNANENITAATAADEPPIPAQGGMLFSTRNTPSTPPKYSFMALYAFSRRGNISRGRKSASAEEKANLPPPSTTQSPLFSRSAASSRESNVTLSNRLTEHTLISSVCIFPLLPVMARDKLTFAAILTLSTPLLYHNCTGAQQICAHGTRLSAIKRKRDAARRPRFPYSPSARK